MMVTTHSFAGLFICAPLAIVFPEHAPTIALMALFGGLFPDLDIVVGQHRKTLHHLVGYNVSILVALCVVVLAQNALSLGLLAFTLGAGLHSVSDIFGGGLEKKPWEQKTDRCVYCHVSQKWIAPKYFIAYDGSKGDLLATCLLASSVLAYSEVGFLWPIIGLGLAIAIIYTSIRRWLPTLEDWLLENIPILHPFLNGLH